MNKKGQGKYFHKKGLQKQKGKKVIFSLNENGDILKKIKAIIFIVSCLNKQLNFCLWVGEGRTDRLSGRQTFYYTNRINIRINTINLNMACLELSSHKWQAQRKIQIWSHYESLPTTKQHLLDPEKISTNSNQLARWSCQMKIRQLASTVLWGKVLKCFKTQSM